MVDWDPVEGYGGESEEECHAPHGGKKDSSSAEAIDDHQVNPGEEEVGGCDDGSDGYGIGEADKCEEGRGVVHETVETAELTDGHETAGCDECAEIAGDDVELLEKPEIAFSFLDCLCFGDVAADVSDLLLDLLGSSLGEDCLDDNCCSFRLVVIDELTGRFWAEWQ